MTNEKQMLVNDREGVMVMLLMMMMIVKIMW